MNTISILREIMCLALLYCIMAAPAPCYICWTKVETHPTLLILILLHYITDHFHTYNLRSDLYFNKVSHRNPHWIYKCIQITVHLVKLSQTSITWLTMGCLPYFKTCNISKTQIKICKGFTEYCWWEHQDWSPD